MQIGLRQLLLLLGGCVSLAFATHVHFFALGDVLALRGFSILEVLAAHADPQAFARDYPGGARLTTTNSPTVHLYTFGQDYLGLDALVMLYGMILFEICVLTFGLWLLWSAIFERCKSRTTDQDGVMRIAFVWLVLLVLVSSNQKINMFNFGFPFFHGQFYGFADGLRLAALAMIVRRRWELAAVAFVLCFAIHPIKAAMASAFALGILAVDWRNSLTPRALLAMAATLICWVGWYTIMLRGDSEGVPLEAFVAFTRAMQSHWYPVDLGLLGRLHDWGITPSMALLLVTFIALRQPGWSPSLSVGILVGFAILTFLTAVGIWISIDASSAGLLKLSIARASTMISLCAPMIILIGACFAWQEKRLLLMAGLLAFLWVGFLQQRGPYLMTPLFAIALATIHVVKQPRDARWMLILAGPIAVVSIWYWAYFPKDFKPASFLVAAAFWLVLALLVRLGPSAKQDRRSVPVALIAISLFFGVGAGYWSIDRGAVNNQESALAYKEAQLWARNSTPSGTLFMVDPCRWYGWRDFSHRASIGTMREWYMTAWIYNDRADLLDRGHQIAVALGAGFEPKDAKPRGSRMMCDAARVAYYDPDLAGPRRVAEKFGVDYFVFEKAYTDGLPEFATDHFAFENEHFAILPADRLINDR